MKKILLFIFSISALTISAFSQNFSMYEFKYDQDTIVYVKGYYIINYLEKDILEMKMNEELKRQGRWYNNIWGGPHSGASCYSLQVKNDISQASSNILLDAADIAPLFRVRRIIRNLEIFKFPPYKGKQLIEKFFNNHDGLKSRSEEIIDKRIEFPDADYYKLENDSIVCKIYYVEGWALRATVKTDYLNLLNGDELNSYGLTFPPIPNESIASFFMYMFYDIDMIDSNRPPAGFVKWEPEFTAKDLDRLEKRQKRNK